MLSDFHFIRPAWLFAILPLVVGIWSLGRAGAFTSAWTRLFSKKILQYIVVNRTEKGRITPFTMLAGGGLLGIVALAGPTWEPEENTAAPSDSALVVVIEVTPSMTGRDVGPSRLARAKLKVREIIDSGQVGRLGLIAYAGSPHTVMPLTGDQEIIIPYLDALAPEVMPLPGNQADTAVSLITKMRTGIETPLSVLLISDGLSPAEVERWNGLGAAKGICVTILAMGTRAGVPSEQIPPLDMSGFEKLSASIDATLISLSVGGGDTREIIRTVQRHHRSALKQGDNTVWRDMGYYLVFPFALIVLFWFRRGWVVHVTSILALFTITGCNDVSFADLFATRDQKGRRLFEARNFEEAAERFTDPMWKGIAFYAAENWDAAIETFSKIESPEGNFNLGNAYAQKGELITAVGAYEKALEKRPLYKEARANRDLFKHYLKSLKVSDDAEEVAKGPIENSAEAAVKLTDQQKSGSDNPLNPFEKAERSEAKATAPLTKEMDAAWMRKVTTRPADFLRAKFAAQGTGGDR